MLSDEPIFAPVSARSAGFLPPMLALRTRIDPGSRLPLPGSSEDWLLEPKFDGLRCLAIKDGSEVSLWSRNRQSFSARFKTVVESVRGLVVDSVVLDGEITAMVGGRSDFSALQQGDATPVFWVFDVLYLLGHDTTPLALEERKSLLARVLPNEDMGVLRAVQPVEGTASESFHRACESGWEGLIAKRRGSAYISGRSPLWRKLKCVAGQELVIGGFTDPRGARQGFGALLVGYYSSGQLHFAGRVGTGFSERTLRELFEVLAARQVGQSPFMDSPRLAGAHWVAPEIVVQIAFSEWTRDGKLRHPRFEGMRTDKDPLDVVREDTASNFQGA